MPLCTSQAHGTPVGWLGAPHRGGKFTGEGVLLLVEVRWPGKEFCVVPAQGFSLQRESRVAAEYVQLLQGQAVFST
jgi:hypothetical protein